MSPEPLPETGVLTNQIANFVNGRRRTLWLFNVDKFFDPSTPSMRKGRDGEWNGKKKWKKNNGENSGPLSLLPVDRLTPTDCNADRSCQFL